MAYSSRPHWRSASPMWMRGPGGPSRLSFSLEKISEDSSRVADFPREEWLFLFLRVAPAAGRFVFPADRSAESFAPVFCLGMAIFVRIEEPHHCAVERLAVSGAENVAAQSAARAAIPNRSGIAGRHECDTDRH